MKGSLAGRHHLVKGARELRADEVPAPARARFVARLRETASGCIEWRGAVNGDGYGIVRITNTPSRLVLAHRLAWALEHGSCPAALILDHFACSNHRCCAPRHLRPTSPEVNTPAIYGNARPAAAVHHGFDDARGRHFETAAEWIDEVERLAELRFGPRCEHGYRYHAHPAPAVEARAPPGPR